MVPASLRKALKLRVAAAQAPFQAQNLSNVSHGQSFRRHHPLRRTAFDQNGNGKTTPRDAPEPPSSGGERGDHDAVESVITTRGTGDHDAVE